MDWVPWVDVADYAQDPIIRWFSSAKINAAFNELDRSVLQGSGERTAFVHDVPSEPSSGAITYAALLKDSAAAAMVLHGQLALGPFDRVALSMPNDPDAIVWIEAAKRCGNPFVAIASGTAPSSLGYRMADAAATVLVVSADMLSAALEVRSDAVSSPFTLVARTDDAAVIDVVQNCHLAAKLLDAAKALLRVPPETAALVSALWERASPVPVDSSHPLFILYTSGSTGKPKGIVHTHGGYHVGLHATGELVMNLDRKEDTFLVVATVGWITGQSYMIATAMLHRVTSVLVDGSPVSPPERFAQVSQRHGVTVLKAGSTFMRMFMSHPNAATRLADFNLQKLRLGIFCAEPVNQVVHSFATQHVTPNYVNCYWATEHGGIIFGLPYEKGRAVTPDTSTRPLHWIAADVLVSLEEPFQRAEDGEQGDVAIINRYPYQAFTVWQSSEFGTAAWTGNLERWAKYFQDGVYVQGDAAIRHEDGSFTFHGRTDEVINVGGNRIGTAEVENALLSDGAKERSWAISTCAVVGVPDGVLGTVPCAFLVLRTGSTMSNADQIRLKALVREMLGENAVPRRIIAINELPTTHSGKIVRRLLRALVADGPLGDLSTLSNPGCVDGLRKSVKDALGSVHDAQQTLQSRPSERAQHALLKNVAFVGDSVIYRTSCAGAFASVFEGHIIHGATVVPGAGYIEIASSGRVATANGGGTCPFGNIMFVRPMVLGDPDLFMELELSDHGPFEVRSGKLSTGWMYDPARHSTGDSGSAQSGPSLTQASRQGMASWDLGEQYDTFARLGLQYGPAYIRLVQGWKGDGVAIARLQRRNDRQGTNVHPADLDAVIQVCLRPPSDSVELKLPFVVEHALVQVGFSPGLWAVR
jgi:acyl-coenzyme A synthetase/AMP-(fatty) acid ligase